MFQFIQDNNLVFYPFTIKIENNKKIYPKDDKMTGWNTKTHQECLRDYKDKTTNKHYLIKCNNEFIIFDTDTVEDNELLTKTLKELDLYNESSITKSTRGEACDYKRHFWFRVREDEFKTFKKHKFNNMEVFIGNNCNIAEPREANITNIKTLTIDNYKYIMSQFVIPETLKTPVMIYPLEPPKSEQKNLITILENINPKRFIDYNSWVVIYMIFINEELDISIFNHYSKKYYKDYNEQENQKILKNIKICKGYKIASLYHFLKEDNKKVFDELQETRDDFWNIFEDLKNNYDPAIYYYSLNPNKYLRSNITGWYEYNENNILIPRGVLPYPVSMVNDITDHLRKELAEQRNYLLPKDKNDKDYNKKMEIFKKAYHKVGLSSYVKSMIDYLIHLYTVDDIDDLFDNNKNLFAFNNELYDNSIKEFRKIKPTDYITKTTKYNINKKSNPAIRAKITSLIRSMFENDEIYNYHMQTIALSMFGNSQEAFYINSGNGRNGKGVCSSFIENSFGSYFYSGESTFFTTVYKADRPNPTLFNLKGVRYFLTTEPEADNETKFNIGLIKKITGNDTITTRDLNKSNISYKPQFTAFLQCNKKPNIDKVDDAIKNRFRIINFPFAFVQEPTKPNEKKIDTTLKSTIDQTYYNEFILLIIDISKTLTTSPKIPQEVIAETSKYLNSNNTVLQFLNETFDISPEIKDKIKFSDLLQAYNSLGEYTTMSPNKFNEALEMNSIKTKKYKDGKYILNIRYKINDD